MPYTITQLQTFFTNANAGTAPTAAQLTGLQGIANQNATGALTDAQALQSAIDMGSDVTTAVSVQTYQFFLGFAPSVDGLKALNAAYVGSGAQAGLNGENRFIAQSVSLALQNPTAKASFAAAYGASSVADATAAAYNVVIGNAAAAAAGVNVANAVAFLSSASSVAYYTAFVKANVPGLTAQADIDLAVKAAIVGEIIYQATIYNNGAGLGSYATAANNLVKDLADDGALTANNAAGINLFASYGIPTAPQTPVLTVSATDNITTGNGADTITGQWGQTTTLQASDKIDGGAGVDTLRIVTDAIPGQATAATVSGFTVSNVEVLEIQAQNANGTTLGLENVTGVTTIRSSASNSALVLDNVKAIAGLEIVNALNAGNLTVNYAAAAVSGSADTQTLALNGNNAGTLTVNGIETLAVTTATANSTIANLALGGLSKITVAGDKALTVTAALANTVTTVDASAQTAGGITITAGNAAVAVTGGAGADKVTFAAGEFTSADAYNGGAGRDTVVVAVADLTAAAGAKLSNVEIVELSTALTADFDTSRITGEDTYALNAGFTGPVSLTKVTDASTVNVKAASTGTLTVSIGDGATLATATGTANTLSLAVGGANGVNAGTVAAAGVETLTLASNGSAATAGGNTLTIVDADATKLTVTGAEDLTLTMTGTALTTLDASGSTGANDFSAVTFKAATSATITGGSGVDKINGSAAADTINGGAGADVILGGGGADTLTGGAGADTFAYNLVSDSSGAAQDTITDFVSGTDLINLQNLAAAAGRTTIELRSGDAANFGAAQAAILQNSGKTQVVFQADTNTLWVDLNDDGTLNNNDLAIKLTGVTKVTAADIGGTATPGGSGNIISLSAPNAVSNNTTNTFATNKTTAFADQIFSTIANLNGSTVDGQAGDDVLNVTDAGTLALGNNSVTNVETVVLANGANTFSLGTGLAVKAITGGTGADDISLTNLTAGGAVNAGAGNDTVKNATEALVEGVGSTFVGGDGADTFTFAAALGATATLDLSSISGFETLDLGQVGGNVATTSGKFASGVTTLKGDTTNGDITVNMTAAQLDALTTITSAAGGNNFKIQVTDTTATTVNLADTAGTVANVDLIDFSANNLAHVVTINANTVVKGGTSTTDKVILTGDVNATLAATGFNLLDVTVAQTGLTINNDFVTTTATAGGTFTLGTGGDTFNAQGTVAYTITDGAGADTITITSTAANTINVTGGGINTVTLNTAAAADTVVFDTVAASANRTKVENFAWGAGADVVRIDDAATAAGTAAGAAAVLQLVSAAGNVAWATNNSDVLVLNFDMGGATDVLSADLTGAALLANLGTITTAANDEKGYILAYDNGTAYLYYVNNGGGNTAVTAAEIALIGTFTGTASGTIATGDITMI